MRPTWRLSLFGTVGLHSDHESLTAFETKRAAKLLVLLALSRTGKMRRDDVADLLWPEDFIDSTRLRLRQELSRLRRGLGGNDELIETPADYVSLDRSLVENDLERLARPSSLPAGELIGLLTQPFLPGWDDAWVTAKREEVDQLRIRAALIVSWELIERNETDDALQLLQACTPISPLNEELRDLTMKAHNTRGSLADALGEFRRFKKAESPLESKPHSSQSHPEISNFDVFELPQPPHPIDQFFGRKQLCQDLREILQSSSET
ncbi:MAG: BTAD domain-containing putative transcriptional regulator, partial [Armatimonadota bacterium]